MAGAFVIAHATKATPAAIPRPVLCIVSSLLLQTGVDAWHVLQNETLVLALEFWIAEFAI
jgi:hypothetical protein